MSGYSFSVSLHSCGSFWLLLFLWNQNFWFMGMFIVKCLYCCVDLQKTTGKHSTTLVVFKVLYFFPILNGRMVAPCCFLIFIFYIPDNWGGLMFVFRRHMLCDGEAFWKLLFYNSDSGL